MTKSRAASIALQLVSALARPAVAQTALGTITGTVKDAQGAVLQGATATALNTATNVTTTTVTNGEGLYVLPLVSPQFGSVTETQSNDPRFVQLAFRYSF